MTIKELSSAYAASVTVSVMVIFCGIWFNSFSMFSVAICTSSVSVWVIYLCKLLFNLYFIHTHTLFLSHIFWVCYYDVCMQTQIYFGIMTLPCINKTEKILQFIFLLFWLVMDQKAYLHRPQCLNGWKWKRKNQKKREKFSHSLSFGLNYSKISSNYSNYSLHQFRPTFLFTSLFCSQHFEIVYNIN